MIGRLRQSSLLARTLIRVLPFATIAVLLIGAATSSVLERSLYAKVRADQHQDAKFGAATLSLKLNVILSSIRSVAANNLVINALVDTDTRQTYVPLYFGQLHIGGLRTGEKISFTDYRGRLIAANWKSPGYKGANWISQVISEGREHVVLDGKGGLFVVPVLYDGVPEGAIVVEFTKAQLAQMLAMSSGTRSTIVDSPGGALYASDPKFAKVYAKGIDSAKDWITSTARVPGFDELRVVIAEPMKTALAWMPKFERSFYLVLGLVLLALTAGICSVAFLTSNPLSRFVADLKRFGAAHDLDRRIESDGASEFRDLADAFNSMLERLQSTVVSHEQLAREVDVRKEAEQALWEQNERFNTALENMSHGLCVFDRESRLVVCNERYATLYGLAPVTMTPGMTARDIAEVRIAHGIYAGASAEAYVDHRINWGREHGNKTQELLELNDGRTIRVSRQPLSDGGWVTTHEDVTEIKRMERLKNEFVSVVSHELRTPLTSLTGSLRLLSSGALGPLPEKASSLMDIAYRNTRRLTVLVNDILDVEKIKSGQLDFEFARTDLAELARHAIEENQAYAAEHGVLFRVEEDIGKAPVTVDADRILQVFANLLSNAAKFSPKGADVVLRLTRAHGRLRCAVVDQGSGIPKDKQAQLFDRFFQVDASDSRSRQGTGLGLSIVKAIVEEHGSHIHVESDVDQGATFYFDLAETGPKDDHTSQSATASSAA